ncbi:hypothetical protein [Desulfovibrio inopinatus]|uniref:hypothetical protein n=1 Tax=Desulfovibrio inopinatus TaxID=102109 RepID=UPI000405CE3F|nr:hypothetical protein [Desulfovibrio inopinatus]
MRQRSMKALAAPGPGACSIDTMNRLCLMTSSERCKPMSGMGYRMTGFTTRFALGSSCGGNERIHGIFRYFG